MNLSVNPAFLFILVLYINENETGLHIYLQLIQQPFQIFYPCNGSPVIVQGALKSLRLTAAGRKPVYDYDLNEAWIIR